VQGIGGDELSLGFVPFAYYEGNREKLKMIPVDDENAANGAGPIAPSAETIRTGTYQPFARPIFIYVSKKAAEKPAVQQFADYYLAHAETLVKEVGYVGLGDVSYKMAGERFAKRVTGTLFAGASQAGLTIEQLLAKERAQ
jgi:phosphate transport system substrate-binding protein